MAIIFSGIAPSGNLHIGNYFGSIANWKDLLASNQCFFGIMDLHAITTFQDPKELNENIIKCAAIYLACGLKTDNSLIFAQSKVAAHSQLAWILSCFTPLGWLNRMTQYKDKIQKNQQNQNLGLYSYPVLMAADILLYNANIVPVGEDQKQHLELARDIAICINQKFNKEIFCIPEPKINQSAKRIMSLKDGNSKMSKSDDSDYGRINFSDDNDLIVKKIKKAKTDSHAHLSYEKERPEIYNLINIYSILSKQNPDQIISQFSNFGSFKANLADLMIAEISPIRQKINQYLQDASQIQKILDLDCQKANDIANNNLNKITKTLGL